MNDLDEDRRPPTLAELSSLLKTYFIDATDEHAEKLRVLVASVLGDSARLAAEASAFDPGRRSPDPC